MSNGGLYDPNFRHTVVLVVDHDDEGALGIVLNRPGRTTVEEAIPELLAIVAAQEPLFIGGPVQPEAAIVLAEFDELPAGESPIMDKIALLAELDLSATPDVRRARVFGGYSGWGPGQLEDEIARDDWIIEPAQPEDVFTDDPKELWKRILARKGGRFRMLSTMPFDPSIN